MELLLLELGMKDSIFVGLFIWLLIYVLNTSSRREEKLYGFLNDMKFEFSKLVTSYGSLTEDVTEIRQELHEFKDKK